MNVLHTVARYLLHIPEPRFSDQELLEIAIKEFKVEQYLRPGIVRKGLRYCYISNRKGVKGGQTILEVDMVTGKVTGRGNMR